MSTPLDHHAAVEGIVTLHLPAKFGYLRIARQTTLDFCARAGLSEFRSAQLEMAVDEACSNIIEHSYGDAAPDAAANKAAGIQLNLIQHTARVVVEIHDFGRGFDYAKASVVEPEEYIQNSRARGLGLYIIRNFVDELSYDRNTAEGNRLRLVKNIK